MREKKKMFFENENKNDKKTTKNKVKIFFSFMKNKAIAEAHKIWCNWLKKRELNETILNIQHSRLAKTKDEVKSAVFLHVVVVQLAAFF